MKTDELFGPPIKEILLTVPYDYDPKKGLERPEDRNIGGPTHYYNPHLTDENFSKVSHPLVRGKTYRVLFIPINARVTSKECIHEYYRQKAFFVGAQGLKLLQETHPDEFPVGKYPVSFDEEENLPIVGGYHRVPIFEFYPNGDWRFDIACFELKWSSIHILIVFCEAE